MRFALNQGTVDSIQYADMVVPGCGHKNMKDAAIIRVEIRDGKPTLLVWSDISQEEPTHIISLVHALESNREEDDG
jgi:hypothetical protein